MNDRELLELAAKAAGVTGEWCDCPDCGLGGVLTPDDNGKQWNPLLDDGDALWLTVRLDIELRFHLAGSVPAVTATCAANSRMPIPREPWGSDKYAATRRAIVRAAAEIGKAMP